MTAASSRMLRRFRVREFKIDGRAVAPESFEPVEFARFLVHDMNHEITVVQQHSTGPSVRPSRERGWWPEHLRNRSFDFLGHGQHLALVGGARDHHDNR